MTSNPQCWEFDRYRNGRLMAEGIRITREKSLEMALQAATALADRGDVLVLRSSRETTAGPAEKPKRYDHKYEPGAYGVCRRCGDEVHP